MPGGGVFQNPMLADGAFSAPLPAAAETASGQAGLLLSQVLVRYHLFFIHSSVGGH